MSRSIKLTDNQAVDWVKDVVYNTAGQLTQMKYTRDTSGNDYYTDKNADKNAGHGTQTRFCQCQPLRRELCLSALSRLVPTGVYSLGMLAVRRTAAGRIGKGNQGQ